MKTFTAIFYSNRAEEHRITGKCKSKAEFMRFAKHTAKIRDWRLVEVFEGSN